MPNLRSGLILEDEALISLELEDVLSNVPVEEVVVLTRVDAALKWLESNTPDIAIVDYWLNRVPTEAVVDALRRKGVPVIIYSGTEYDAATDSASFRDVPWLQKPQAEQAFRQTINSFFEN